jgi:hypothetical protein
MADVEMLIEPDARLDVGMGSGEAMRLIFTPQNWHTPQVVIVTAAANNVPEGARTMAIAHQLLSDDPLYDGMPVEPLLVSMTDLSSGGPSVRPGPVCGLLGFMPLSLVGGWFWLQFRGRSRRGRRTAPTSRPHSVTSSPATTAPSPNSHSAA